MFTSQKASITVVSEARLGVFPAFTIRSSVALASRGLGGTEEACALMMRLNIGVSGDKPRASA